MRIHKGRVYNTTNFMSYFHKYYEILEINTFQNMANRKRIVGRGVIPPFSRSTPLFSKIPPFLETQDVSTFHRSIGKTKVLNNSCNQFLYNFYPQSMLILEECLQK